METGIYISQLKGIQGRKGGFFPHASVEFEPSDILFSDSKMVQNYCLKLACFLSKYLAMSLLDLFREALSCPTKRLVTGYTLLLIYLSLNSPP